MFIKESEVTKIYQFVFILLIFSFINNSINAQTIITYNGHDIKNKIQIDQKVNAQDFQHLKSNDKLIVGAKFTSIPNKKQIQKLEKDGVELLQYLSNSTYLVRLSNTFNPTQLKTNGGEYLFELPAASKIDPALLNVDTGNLKLMVHANKNLQESVLKDLSALGIQQKDIISKEYHVITIVTNADKIERISTIPAVTYIGLDQDYYSLMDIANTQNGFGVANTQSTNSYGLTGAGVVVGVSDVGPVANQHIDHKDRILVDNSIGGLQSFSYHGNHVLGTIGGAGIMNEQYKGIATGSELIFSPINTLHNSYYIDNNNMVLTNHSYAAVLVNGSEYGGKYTSHPTLTDQRIQMNDQVMEVWAAGNSDQGFQSLANGYNVAKNVLTVSGSSISQTIGVFRSASVSMGPTLDGRIKPEVCANFKNYSTNSENNYRSATGTSMAAPTLTGALALLYEHYRNLNNGDDPKSATLKAIVANTADDYGNEGPDYKWGFGNLNLNKSLKAITNTRYIESTIGQFENTTHSLTVPSNVKQVKVMLYWHDKYGTPNCSTNCLVNDLDLNIISPNSSNILPLILDPSDPDAIATNGVDRLNNIEQIIIDNPNPGIYDININGFVVPFGDIDYSIAYEFITDEMEITFPFDGEKLISNAKYHIIWEDHIAESNTYNIEYSSNGGSSWNMIEQNYLIEAFASRTYYWDLPALNTDKLKVRISSNGRVVESGNIIVSERVKINDYLYFDENNELAISWNGIQGASSYNIYKYTTGDQTPILLENTNTTNKIISGLEPHEENYMIVEPVFTNGAGLKSPAVKALAPILYVDDSANGNNDGSSWANAFTSLKKAVAHGAKEIWIAEGTYSASDSYLSLRAQFNLLKGVQLFGGFPNPSNFAGGNPNMNDRDWKTYQTIIDAGNAYHQVFLLNNDNALNGIFVKDQTSNQNGGVVLIKASGQSDQRDITIENCSFSDISGTNGAGIYVIVNSKADVNLNIENVIFENISGSNGSNLFFKAVGSGVSINAEITNCSFKSSHSANSGIYGLAKSSSTINLKLQNSVITESIGNSIKVTAESNAKYNFDLYNSTITNSSLSNGSYVIEVSSETNAKPSKFNIYNGILWDDNSMLHTNNGQTEVNLFHSLIKESNCPEGTNCCDYTIYNEDPMFTDEVNADYSLKEFSPAIDMGTDSVDILFDKNYDPRPQGISLDLGAYESEYTAAGLELYIKLFLEGSYNNSGNMKTDYYAQNYLSLSQPYNVSPWNYNGNEAVTDYSSFERVSNGNTIRVSSWVLVNILDANNSNNILKQQAAMLWEDGSITDIDHNLVKVLLTPDLYYVAVLTSGHLGVMTATPLDFTQANLVVDFSNPSFAVMGGNDAQKEIDGINMLICGDVNGDGIINAGDRSPVWTARNSIGNNKEDINKDGICNAADRTKVWNNRNRFSYLPF